MENKSIAAAFGEKLKHLRENHNVTQAQLAAKLNVTQQTVASWENGRTEPSMTTVTVLAGLFDVGVQYFYERGEESGNMITPEFLAIKRNILKMTDDQLKKTYSLLKLSFEDFDWKIKKKRKKSY